MLRNAKINRKSIQYGFKGTERFILTEDQLIEQVKKLKQGDKEAQEKIVLGHLNLAVSIASRYANQFPNKISVDLAGEAMQAMCSAVNRVRRGYSMEKHNNITGFIVKSIQGHLMNYIKSDFVIVPVINDLEADRRSLANMIPIHDPVQFKDIGGKDPYSLMYFNEILESPRLTKLEKEIIIGRLNGDTIRELSISLDISTTQISRKIKEIGKKIIKMQSTDTSIDWSDL